MDNITLGSISAILTFTVAFIGSIEFLAMRMRKYIRSTMKDEIEPIKHEMKTLKEELNENTLNTMKNTICNELIPLSERIDVGEKYVEKGGNGAVKIYYHELEEKYNREIKERR